jgi:hypothetical protein
MLRHCSSLKMIAYLLASSLVLAQYNYSPRGSGGSLYGPSVPGMGPTQQQYAPKQYFPAAPSSPNYPTLLQSPQGGKCIQYSNGTMNCY